MAEILRFEDFELDRTAYELRWEGRAVRLERIPLDLLFLLAERRGQLVTRQDILERVWGKDVALETDTSINTAVRKIRRAMRDNPESPRFLHTIPGKGYRLEIPGVPQDEPVAPVPPPEAVSAPARNIPRWQLWPAVAGMIAIAALLLAWTRLPRSAGPDAGKVMLVVLPFVNLSGDPGQDYFADGMTEEMITELGSLDPLRLGVIARTSAMQYKGAKKSTAEIAQELHVNYLLEGSIRRAGGRVRVTGQLIQAGDQTHLWSGNFDRDLGDVMEVQDEVARAIAGKIQVALPHPADARKANRVNAEAHEAYLQGLQAWNLRTDQSWERAVASFSRAIAIDPNYAAAHVGLARVYSLAGVFSRLKTMDIVPKAREEAMRALELDDSLADAHVTLAFVKAHYESDWPGAEREYRRGLELNPSDANCHLFYSNSYLSPLGRHDEAIAEMKKAIELDPLSIPIQSFAGRTWYWARRYDESLAQFQKVNRMEPNFALNHQRLAHLYHQIGKFAEAIDEQTKARVLEGEDPQLALARAAELRRWLAARGPRGYWEKLLELHATEGHHPEDEGLAILYTRLGEKEKALENLEESFAEARSMVEVGVEPAFDALRSEPRFQELLRKAGLAR